MRDSCEQIIRKRPPGGRAARDLDVIDDRRDMSSSEAPLENVLVTPTARGARITLRVKPSARRAAVEGEHGGALKVSVIEPPEKGKANAGVLKLLAKRLRVPASALELVAGHSSRTKIVEVTGLEPAEVRARLGRAEDG